LRMRRKEDSPRLVSGTHRGREPRQQERPIVRAGREVNGVLLATAVAEPDAAGGGEVDQNRFRLVAPFHLDAAAVAVDIAVNDAVAREAVAAGRERLAGAVALRHLQLEVVVALALFMKLVGLVPVVGERELDQRNGLLGVLRKMRGVVGPREANALARLRRQEFGEIAF